MLNMGYGVYEFDITGSRTVNDFEIVFCREHIVECREVDYSTIWN